MHSLIDHYVNISLNSLNATLQMNLNVKSRDQEVSYPSVMDVIHTRLLLSLNLLLFP